MTSFIVIQLGRVIWHDPIVGFERCNMKKVYMYMEKILHILLAVLLVCMVSIVMAQVIARYVFSSPITWSEEMVRYLFIWSVMTGAIAAMAKDTHLNVDLFSEKISPKARIIRDTVIRAVVCAYLVCLALGGWLIFNQVLSQFSATMRISMAIPYSSIGICAAVMVIQEIYFVIRNLKKLIGREKINV